MYKKDYDHIFLCKTTLQAAYQSDPVDKEGKKNQQPPPPPPRTTTKNKEKNQNKPESRYKNTLSEE